jgi:hypothetical protein
MMTDTEIDEAFRQIVSEAYATYGDAKIDQAVAQLYLERAEQTRNLNEQRN